MSVLEERRELLAEVGTQRLVDLLHTNAVEYADDAALSWRDGDAWTTATWACYRGQVDRAAAGLVAAGVQYGDHVAILAGNRPEHVVADLAALTIGGVPVSVYLTLTPDQISYVLRDAAVTLLVVENVAALERLAGIRADLPDLRTVVVIDANGADVDSWANLLAQGEARLAEDSELLTRAAEQCDGSDPATVIYTSGTTGPPKGVVLTQANVLFLLASLDRVTSFEEGFDNISYLPMAHIAERLFSHYIGLVRHGHTWFCADQSLMLPTLVAARPHAFLGVPRVWEKLMSALSAMLPAAPADLPPETRAAVVAKIGLDRCSFAASGSAPIGVDVLEFWSDLGVPILEAYGMTETTGVTNINRPGDALPGTVGPAIPGVELRLAEDGEIEARGPNLMPGYLNKPEATAEVIDRDGWLKTGDLGEMTDDGRLRIVGRKKELIVTAGGKNIAPVPIENAVKESPLVGQICVIGDRRPYLTALVVLDAEAPREDVDVDAEVARAVEAANQQFSRVEQIKKYAILDQEWTPDGGELTPTLKLRRSVIHDKYADVIDGLYT